MFHIWNGYPFHLLPEANSKATNENIAMKCGIRIAENPKPIATDSHQHKSLIKECNTLSAILSDFVI
jgi:hypothetical protein